MGENLSKYKDGDIIAFNTKYISDSNYREWVVVYGCHSNDRIHTHAAMVNTLNNSYVYISKYIPYANDCDGRGLAFNSGAFNVRYATKDEANYLLKMIKHKGYKWDNVKRQIVLV